MVAAGIAVAGTAAAGTVAAGAVAESSHSQERYLQVGLGEGDPSNKISELILTLMVS